MVFVIVGDSFVVDTSKVGVLKFDGFEFGWEDIHFAAIFEDDFIV